MKKKFLITSETRPKEPGSIPFRVVLAKTNGYMPWVVWVESPSDAEDGWYQYWGSYYRDVESAMLSYIQRCREHNLDTNLEQLLESADGDLFR